MESVKNRMEKTIETLKKNFAGVRTGRANPALVENILVEAYGQKMPVKQIASIHVQDSRSIAITPFDKSNAQAIDKAISLSDLGLTPKNEGHVLRINIPELTEDRRKELDKVVKNISEESKVAIRNVRRDALDELKNNKELSQDESHGQQNQIQKITDEYIAKIDALLKKKEAEIKEI